MSAVYRIGFPLVLGAVTVSAATGPHGASTGTDPAETRKAVQPATGAETECARDPKCSRLANCAEARDQLTRCGASQLDRDHDGIPCEVLCGKR